jgi:hypothetical protein
MEKNKHQIDELFGQLGQHNSQPSPQAWQKLQKRLPVQPHKRKPVLYWRQLSVAASIALLVMIGLPFYVKNNSSKSKTQNAKPKARKQIAQAYPSSSATQQANTAAFLQQTIAQHTSQVAAQIDPKKRTYMPKKQKATANEGLLAQNKAALNQEITNPSPSAEPATQLAINQPNVVEPSTNTNSNTAQAMQDKPSHVAPPTDADKLTLILTLTENTSPASNYSQAINNETESKQSKKDKYLNKLFRQLMNAKRGEQVDWQEVGFKPAKILARAESKLRHTETDLKETYYSTKDKTIF